MNDIRIIFCFVIISISSCQMVNEEKVALQESNTSNAFINIVDSISLFPLTNDSDHLIGSTLQLLVDNDGFILVDAFNAIINKYGVDGHFISAIGRKGNGPGEYPNISNVQLKQGTIIVFSMPGIVNEYDKYGKFLRKTEIESLGDQSVMIDDGILTYYGYKQYPNYRMAFIDNFGKEKHYLYTENRVIHYMTQYPVFCVNLDEVYLVDSYSEVIYRFSKGKCEPYLHFDFGKYAIPDEFYKFADVYDGMSYLLSRKFATINQIIKDEKYTIVQVAIQDQDTVKSEYYLSYEGASCWFSLNNGNSSPSPILSWLFFDKKLYCLIDINQIDSLPKDFTMKIAGGYSNSELQEDGLSYAVAEIALK